MSATTETAWRKTDIECPRCNNGTTLYSDGVSNPQCPLCMYTASEKKRSKYHAIKTEVDGVLFDSKAEATAYGNRKLAERSGYIKDLELQPRYPLVVNGVKVGVYIADFKYINCATGATIVEDVKGVRTPVYRLKKKLVKALYGIDILESSADGIPF